MNLNTISILKKIQQAQPCTSDDLIKHGKISGIETASVISIVGDLTNDGFVDSPTLRKKGKRYYTLTNKGMEKLRI